MSPASTAFENERLGVLRSYDILDTPREKAFDEIVALASLVCATPVALVSLVASDRQWFKAELGLGVCETPLQTSICAHAIIVGDFMEVPDTLADPRTRDYELCQGEEGLRFYAGAVLLARGAPIGTLCVLDYVPRVLDDVQRQVLRGLAKQVVAQLDLRAALMREALLRKEIDHRVKNSLQSVGAFARLQRRVTTDGEVTVALRAVEQQIDSVALLHDLLSDDDDQSGVDLAVYLDRLTRLVASTAPRLSVTGSFDAIPVSASVAGTIGAIVNELVANALKHSFAGDAVGHIILSGRRLDDGCYRIVCDDDGPGSVVVAEDGRSRLGMRIITASVGQLGGTMEGGRVASGYRTTIEFPVPR